MMWAAISNDRKIDLVHVPGNLAAVRYRGEIVEVVAGAHVYPADSIGVQWDSSPAIWKAMEAH
jgi:hypothetical protein